MPPQSVVQRVYEQPTAPQRPSPPPEKVYVYIPPAQRSTREPDAPPRSNVYAEPPEGRARPETQRATPDPATKKGVPPEQKKFDAPPPKNSPTIPKELPRPIVPQLFTPPGQASPPASPVMEPYKKRGKIGRERDYEKVRKVIVYRVKMNRYQPDLSKEMQNYYDYWYFTKPGKRKDGADYDRHVRAYNRCQSWLAG